MQRNAGGEQRTAEQGLDFNNTDWIYGVMP
jgi:hypothetical protein